MSNVEAEIHATIRTLLEIISRDHGVQIESVLARWVDAARVGEGAHYVTRIEISTYTDENPRDRRT